jgi:hypothetical protein
MKFKCNNESCEDYRILKHEHTINSKWIDGKQVIEQQKCPKCSEEREYIRDHDGFCTTLHGKNLGHG